MRWSIDARFWWWRPSWLCGRGARRNELRSWRVAERYEADGVNRAGVLLDRFGPLGGRTARRQSARLGRAWDRLVSRDQPCPVQGDVGGPVVQLLRGMRAYELWRLDIRLQLSGESPGVVTEVFDTQRLDLCRQPFVFRCVRHGECSNGRLRLVCFVRQLLRVGGTDFPVAGGVVEEAVAARGEGIGISDSRFEVHASELDHVVLFELGWAKNRGRVQAQILDSVCRN